MQSALLQSFVLFSCLQRQISHLNGWSYLAHLSCCIFQSGQWTEWVASESCAQVLDRIEYKRFELEPQSTSLRQSRFWCTLYLRLVFALIGSSSLTRRPQRWGSISHGRQSSQAQLPWSQPLPRPGCVCPQTPCSWTWCWGREQTVEANPNRRFSVQFNDFLSSNWWLKVAARWGFDLGSGPGDLEHIFLISVTFGLELTSCQFSFSMRVKQGLGSRIRQAVWCRVSTVHLTEGLCVCDLWMLESAVVFLSSCVYARTWCSEQQSWPSWQQSEIPHKCASTHRPSHTAERSGDKKKDNIAETMRGRLWVCKIAVCCWFNSKATI